MPSCTRPAPADDSGLRRRVSSAAGALAVAVAAVAAACSGGGETKEVDARLPAGAAANAGRGSPGETLRRFTAAAGRGDAEAMWALLSRPTRATMGGTLRAFRADTAPDFARGVGTIAANATIVLSRRLDARWGVAAIAGERTVAGERAPFAYAAATLRERGQWRLELAGLVMTPDEPEPYAVTRVVSRLRVRVGAPAAVTRAALWLDGRRLPAAVTQTTPFSADVTARTTRTLAPGQHVVVAYAGAGATAAATAWTFSVER